MIQTARSGADIRAEIEAVAGLIQAASATGTFDAQINADAALSRAAFAQLDNAVEIVGLGFPTPTPADPIGAVEFDVAMDVPWHGSFVYAQDFDRGIEYIPPAPSPPAPPPSGFNVPLGDIVAAGDGSWTPGAIPLDDETFVSEAVDRLNEILGLLVPAQPPQFPAGSLSVANVNGADPRLCTSVADATAGASGYAPGAAVTRITQAGVSSFSFGDVGPGNSGTVRLFVNGQIVGERELTGSGDNGAYNGLVISDQKDFPVATPGFWKSFDVTVTNAAALVGINSFRLQHTGAGATSTVFFVRDAMSATSTISAGAVTEDTAVLAYSSGVPHYTTGSKLKVSASINNLAGETYYGGSDVLTVAGTNGLMNNQSFGYAALGITTPIARQTTGVVAMNEVVVNIDGSGHGTGKLRGTGRNTNGSGNASDLSAANILFKIGSAGAKIDEMSVPVSGLGSAPNGNMAVRKGQATGDTPSAAPVAWNSQSIPAAHEATVVAGVLKHDTVNYGDGGYLPVGPLLPGTRTGGQYVTFSFQRSAVSAFKLAVTGSYAGCRIKLPGVSDQAGISPNAPGGWWDASKAYDGAGVPGETGDTLAGCAVGAVMSGSSGNFQITFGTQSSTNATGNEILIRFRLNAGQSITALAISN